MCTTVFGNIKLMETICCDDHFSKDILEWYNTMGIITPVKDKIYSIRGIERTFNGLGIFLNEIVNPVVPVRGVTGIIHKEVSFSHKRFTNLFGESLSISEVLETVNDELFVNNK